MIAEIKQTQTQLKIGLVVNTSDPEIAWNAIRLGIVSLKEGHTVNMFLLADGVEVVETNHHIFDISTKIKEFIDNGGRMFACGTCLNLREQKEIELCPVSTMNDLLSIIEESDRLLSFG